MEYPNLHNFGSLNCPIFGGKDFAEVTPKGGRVSSIFLLTSDMFWCPPYSMGLRYDHNLGDLSDSQIITFIHIYCTFDSSICASCYMWNGGGISESEHFIWKYELISSFSLSCSPYLKMGGISETEHFIWKYKLISGFGLSCALYLKMGGISDLSVQFIWQVDLIVHFIWKLDLIAMTILNGL